MAEQQHSHRLLSRHTSNWADPLSPQTPHARSLDALGVRRCMWSRCTGKSMLIDSQENHEILLCGVTLLPLDEVERGIRRDESA
ncbi:MAG: hypothetical protein WA880_14770, partial [Ornithinimicrobium sp.]